MMDHTLSMAERTGEPSTWLPKAIGSRDSIQLAVEKEEAALDRLPYTRAELQAALDALRDPRRRRR
jgi:hypothetical protein